MLIPDGSDRRSTSHHEEPGTNDLPPFDHSSVDGAAEFSAQWWRWVLDEPAEGPRAS